ncbi:MAG: T9SS type A sorting domain-containing protein [Chitinophagales bacterium]
MKKLSFLLLACFAASSLFAQHDRMVLVEHFTQASCPPCASYNPGFQATLNANHEFIAPIRYQTSWPGFDPMNTDNPGEVATRVGLYNVTGVPNPVLEGDAGATISDNSLNSAHDNSSPFVITLTAELSNILGSNPEDFPQLNDDTQIDVQMNIAASDAVSGNLRAFIVVTEEEIIYDTPPGTNGEIDFYNVMRKMLPNANGTTLDNFANGDDVTLTESWNVASYVNDISQLAVVAFVQDITTREVFQAAVTKPIANESPFSINANLASVAEIPQSCEAGVSPQITVQNLGSETLTSLDIVYSINGTTFDVYTWTGELATLGLTNITLPQVDVPTGSGNENMLSVSVSVSGDENTSNDNGTVTFYSTAVANGSAITVNVTTDNYGCETKWEILDGSTGSVIASGGNPAVIAGSGQYGAGCTGSEAGYASGSTNSEVVTVPSNGCYEFRIVDDYGDGMCCAYGDGAYSLVDQDGNTLVSGGEFGAEEITPFIASLCEAPSSNVSNTDANGNTPNGTITIVASGGDGSYQYSIDGGDTWSTSATFENLASDTYEVVIMDGAGCMSYETIVIESVCNAPTVTASAGVGMAMITLDGGDGPFTIAWSNGVVETGITSSIEELEADIYTAIITDTYGCATTQTVEVTSSVGIDDAAYAGLTISQNYPNPANAFTNITFSGLNKDMSLTVVDVTGKTVATFNIAKGANSIRINTMNIANGSYFYQLMDENVVVATKKLAIVH